MKEGDFVISLIVIVLLGFLIAQPALEAKTFNKFTDGPKATYWDAVFAKLRINGG